MKKKAIKLFLVLALFIIQQGKAQIQPEDHVSLNIIFFVNDNLVVDNISVIKIAIDDSVTTAKYKPGNVSTNLTFWKSISNDDKIEFSFKYFDIDVKKTDTREYKFSLLKPIIDQDYLIIRFYDLSIKKYRKKYSNLVNEGFIYSIESPNYNVDR